MGFGDEVPWAYGLNEIDTLNQQLLADSNPCGHLGHGGSCLRFGAGSL